MLVSKVSKNESVTLHFYLILPHKLDTILSKKPFNTEKELMWCKPPALICNERLVALLHVILFIMLLKATAAALRLLQGKDQLC